VTADKPMSEWPLYKLQRVALVNGDAANECARRYAEQNLYIRTTFAVRVVAAYLGGLRGEKSPRPSINFERPMQRAHNAGALLRNELGRDLMPVPEECARQPGVALSLRAVNS
jgi:hypothetical protein